MSSTTRENGWLYTVVTIGNGKPNWAFRDSDQDLPYLLMAEVSPSSMARCARGCGELIKKGEVRLGEPLKDTRGEYGVISGWKHVRCSRLPKDTPQNAAAAFVPAQHVHGFNKLSEEQQKVVVAELAKSDAPAHLIAIDPEDPAFLGERKLERVKAPPSVALQLLPYQEEGFGWMVKQEAEHQVKGGILADEMGMGKTLQTICLMCNDQQQHGRQSRICMPMSAIEEESPSTTSATSSLKSTSTCDVLSKETDLQQHLIAGPTLVIAPSSAMWQWHDEIVRSTNPGALNIAMYYGQNRNRLLLKSCSKKNKKKQGERRCSTTQSSSSSSNNITATFADDIDVVITTYPILEYEYRKEFDRCKVRCAFCDKTMLPRKLELHYKYFCGPFASRTQKQAMTERGKKHANSAGKTKTVQSAETMAKGMATLGIAKMTGPRQTEDSKLSTSPHFSASSFKAKGCVTSSTVRKPRRSKTAYIIWKEKILRQRKEEEADSSRASAQEALDGGNQTSEKSPLSLQAEWKALSAKARAPYEDAAAADKHRFEDEMATFEALREQDNVVADNETSATKKLKVTSSAHDTPPNAAAVPGFGLSGTNDKLRQVTTTTTHKARKRALQASESKGGATNSKINKRGRHAASVPTLTNIYRELMVDAQREDEIVTMYTRRKPRAEDENNTSVGLKPEETETLGAIESGVVAVEEGDPLRLVGRRVRKNFGKAEGGWYTGRVTAFVDPYWEVTYDADGDTEEFERHELEEIMLKEEPVTSAQNNEADDKRDDNDNTDIEEERKERPARRHPLSRALRELADTLSPGTKDAAPSTVRRADAAVSNAESHRLTDATKYPSNDEDEDESDDEVIAYRSNDIEDATRREISTSPRRSQLAHTRSASTELKRGSAKLKDKAGTSGVEANLKSPVGMGKLHKMKSSRARNKTTLKCKGRKKFAGEKNEGEDDDEEDEDSDSDFEPDNRNNSSSTSEDEDEDFELVKKKKKTTTTTTTTTTKRSQSADHRVGKNVATKNKKKGFRSKGMIEDTDSDNEASANEEDEASIRDAIERERISGIKKLVEEAIARRDLMQSRQNTSKKSVSRRPKHRLGNGRGKTLPSSSFKKGTKKVEKRKVLDTGVEKTHKKKQAVGKSKKSKINGNKTSISKKQVSSTRKKVSSIGGAGGGSSDDDDDDDFIGSDDDENGNVAPVWNSSFSSNDENEDNDDDEEEEEEEEDGDENEESGFVGPGLVVDAEGVDLRLSLLHCVSWHRIVLDEAHKIKGRTNSTGKAVNALHGKRRWCLTGTPIQNRVAELFGLVRFLRHDPYAYYTCRAKGCSCKKLDWQFGSRGARCVDCGHSPMQHGAYFNQEVLNPITKCGYSGAGATAMIKLRRDVLNPIMLRRTKKGKAADLGLPPLNINVEEIELDAAERDFYECVYKRTQSNFSTYVKKKTVLHNYAHIFELLSRLRQALDHPYLVIHGPSADATIGSAATSRGNSDVCGICHLDILSARECAVAACRHTFHRDCIQEYLDEQKQNTSSSLPKSKPRSKKLDAATKGKGSNSEAIDDKITCPCCYQPLTLTMNIRGANDDSSDDDADVVAKAPRIGEKRNAKGTAIMANESTQQQDQGLQQQPECRACFENPRDALYLPCGHMVLCMGCTGKLESKRCPLCRTKIERVVKAKRYDSCSSAPQGMDDSDDHTLNENEYTTSSSTSLQQKKQIEEALVSSRANEGVLKSDAITVGRETILQKLNMSKWQTSSKVEALAKAVQTMMKRNNLQSTSKEDGIVSKKGKERKKTKSDPSLKNESKMEGEDDEEEEEVQDVDKAIVFSQYRTMIDLVEWRLKQSGIEVVKLMGDMPLSERRSTLSAFKSSPSIRVILMSLKTGGEGLNLQEANHVFLLEPWWNPAVEMQAIHRAYRIGQKKPVFATRFITKDSIEEKMYQLQQKKQLVFEGTVDGTSASLSKLTAEDLAFLFHS